MMLYGFIFFGAVCVGTGIIEAVCGVSSLVGPITIGIVATMLAWALNILMNQ